MKKVQDIKKQSKKYERIILKQIGNFIHNQRKEKGVTIKDLNVMTGIGIGIISDLENHKNSMPRIETFVRISEALDIPLSLIFEKMKPITTKVSNGSKIVADDTVNKYDLLASFIAGLDYSNEDVAEVVSYVKYLDYKKRNSVTFLQ